MTTEDRVLLDLMGKIAKDRKGYGDWLMINVHDLIKLIALAEATDGAVSEPPKTVPGWRILYNSTKDRQAGGNYDCYTPTQVADRINKLLVDGILDFEVRPVDLPIRAVPFRMDKRE